MELCAFRASRRPDVTIPALLAGALVLAWAPQSWADDPPPVPQTAAASSPGESTGDVTAYINSMIRAAWKAAEIKPSDPATDAEFLRRVYLDLLGRIPNVDEAGAFLSSKDPARRARLVDALLQHPDFPKHFATVWSVQLVGRRPRGRQVNTAALNTWLRRQFVDEKPWDDTVRGLVTATGNNKENGAVNFSLAHMGDGAVNLTSYTTRLFLGQQIQCTQCHDHPENDWKQADFWGINAFFKGLRSRDVTRVDATGAEVYDATELEDRPTAAYSTFEGRNAMVGIAFPTYLDGRKISQGTDVTRRIELARFITETEDPQFARAFVNRMWGHLMGRGFVNPVDDFGDHNPPSHPELLDRLARDFVASGCDVKALIRWITASEPYQLTSARNKTNEKDESLFSHMQLKPMTPEQLFDSLLVATAAHKAGGEADTDRRRDAWLRQFVYAFGNDEENEGSSFQGTIPQALMMMNGDLMARATGAARGSFLAQVIERSASQRRPEVYVVNLLYLSALSRFPTPAELTRQGRYFASTPDKLALVEDIFWSLLNSNEFILNH